MDSHPKPCFCVCVRVLGVFQHKIKYKKPAPYCGKPQDGGINTHSDWSMSPPTTNTLPALNNNNKNSWQSPKMAAAVMAGISAQRMEEMKFEYFSSLSSMAKKIMQEREIIKARHGPSWDKMTPQEQDNAIDNGMVDPHIKARYAMHRVDREEVVCYPKLLIQTGKKIVHFGEEVVK